MNPSEQSVNPTGRFSGRVEVYAIAAVESHGALRAALERGPQSASVSSVVEEEVEIEARFANGFSIEYDA